MPSYPSSLQSDGQLRRQLPAWGRGTRCSGRRVRPTALAIRGPASFHSETPWDCPWRRDKGSSHCCSLGDATDGLSCVPDQRSRAALRQLPPAELALGAAAQGAGAQPPADPQSCSSHLIAEYEKQLEQLSRQLECYQVAAGGNTPSSGLSPRRPRGWGHRTPSRLAARPCVGSRGLPVPSAWHTGAPVLRTRRRQDVTQHRDRSAPATRENRLPRPGCGGRVLQPLRLLRRARFTRISQAVL
ncbi:PREDICTED: uncharacterized protein LOC105853799 [Condylura cristata]|uniref:uncharacterized protein LOC105853799 n=1 Tax=Condylura cristata TaxID=143302 RepID=UPI0006439035|nr:PREDICTED: uncharacterized protein LOC105853799 [Condylura cristata]